MKDEGGRMKGSVEDGPPPSSSAAGRTSSSFIPHPSSFASLWPPLHVIGKDILIPAHGVYWPVMLKALGFTDDEMPTLLVHGWWNIRGKDGESEKMSKTLGNVIDPDALAEKYGKEAVRYYLMSDISTGKDADFSEERLIQSYNAALANSLGNLLNRTLNMAAKYRSGTVKKLRDLEAGFTLQSEGTQPAEGMQPEILTEEIARLVSSFFDKNLVNHALASSLSIANSMNGYVDSSAPWKLAKDPSKADRLDAVLYTLAESLRIIAILISPVLPRAAHGIFDQLRWKLDEAGHESRFRLADAQWGGLPDGHTLGQPTPLFPRIETPVA
jgi:methionyl-tRNA synthetase